MRVSTKTNYAASTSLPRTEPMEHWSLPRLKRCLTYFEHVDLENSRKNDLVARAATELKRVIRVKENAH